MRNRRILLYESRTCASILTPSLLTAMSVTVEHPVEGAVVVWGTNGDEQQTDRAGLEAALSQSGAVSFQLWFVPEPGEVCCADVFCTVRSIGDRRVSELALDGASDARVTKLADAMIARFLRALADGAADGLVIDPEGFTEDVDWDAVFDGAVLRRSELRLGVRTTVLVHRRYADRLEGFAVGQVVTGGTIALRLS